MHRGIATFTLDYGKCPRWLFERMTKLGREMTRVLIDEYGPDEFIRRISDPVWFQSLGTVLAFDWNASGLTTILTAALKEAIRGQEKDLGLFICGGKGKTSRKTPDEIQNWAARISLSDQDSKQLVYNSRLSAKVDSSLVQDGFQIYHHSFFFSRSGTWAVVQQGMNAQNQTARRYHWFSENVKDFVCEPHSAIATQQKADKVLNLVAKESENTRNASTELIKAGYKSLINEIKLIRKYSTPFSQMANFKVGGEKVIFLNLENKEFHHHPVVEEDFSRSRYLEKILSKVTDISPENYEKLLSIEGVGPKTMRALALVGEIIYGAKPSYRDPARYSFAHGGKDATPYPIDRQTYDETISILEKAVSKSRIEISEKNKALKRLEAKRMIAKQNRLI